MKPRIKICCIGSVQEADMAIRHGASALGLVSAMPSGPGVIDEALITEIAARVPPPIATFLLTAHQDPDAVIQQQRRCGCNTLQLVDAFPVDGYAKLRKALPGIRIVQVLHVAGPATLEEARRIAPHVDALLLDSGNPGLEIRELGGTGRTHDWAISRQIVASIALPVFLAGGLRAENVVAALKTVQPFGLDLCSGVRTGADLDEAKLADFMRAIRDTDLTQS